MCRVHLAITAELYKARHLGVIYIKSAIAGRTQEATLHIAVTYITTDPLLFIIIITIIIDHIRHSSTSL